MNTLTFANEKLNWTDYHPKIKAEQPWQREILMDETTEHSRVYLMGRRMGATELTAIKAINVAYDDEDVIILVPFKNMVQSIKERTIAKLNDARIDFILRQDSINVTNRGNIYFRTAETYSSGQKCKRVISDCINYANGHEIINVLTTQIKKGEIELDLFVSGTDGSVDVFKMEYVRFYHYPGSLMSNYKSNVDDLKQLYSTNELFEKEILAIIK